MSDPLVNSVSLLKATAPSSPTIKRKREVDEEEGRKRSATNPTGQPLLPGEAPNLRFIESAVEAAAAAANTTMSPNITMANAATVAALSALQHATHTTEGGDQSGLTATAGANGQGNSVDSGNNAGGHAQGHLASIPQHTAVSQNGGAHNTHRDQQGDPSDPVNASTTAAAALGSMYPTLHVPTPTEQQFAPVPAGVHVDHGAAHPGPYPEIDTMELARNHELSLGQRKPAVGTPEWHKQRKDNHKEVERRRRETINEGINELAKIVPACEKNKGSILQKAVQFIQQLKANEASNIEKWTLEKLLTEQAIGELSQSNEKLKAECERLYRELETYKRVCQSAGLDLPAKGAEGGPSGGQA